ncbi:uncharacterized protein [Paramisgurnus dabryanus]|uniref:uncharacterized protein n=1 Tax=Paramisgurnus dabryanus TaxID=90735 RepID=UPI003CCF5D57
MAFQDNLTCILFIWLNFIDVSSFQTSKEHKRFNSVGSFNKRAMESYDTKSTAQVGRLLISQPSNYNIDGDLNSPNRPHNYENGYHSGDAGWVNMQPLWGQDYGLNTLHVPAVDRLLGMRPKVDCTGDLMKLIVHGSAASLGSNFLIDRGGISPLPLSQLPSECGHTLLRTWRDFVFIIPFNGCYVSQERDMHILPLLWWGLPIKMSCSSPTLAQSTPAVSCYTNGMIVKLPGDTSMKLKVKVMNEWLSLMKASAKCGYSLVSHPDSVAIHAPYMPCTEAKDGMFTLSMAAERAFNLSCPALSLSLPMIESDTSIPLYPVLPTLAPATTASSTTSQPAVTTMQPYFKPVPPKYPFLIFQPIVPPTVVPQYPKVVAPLPVTQSPQPPLQPKPYDPKPPQIWYPWYPKPTQSLQPKYPVKPVLPPTKADPKPPQIWSPWYPKPTQSLQPKYPVKSVLPPTKAPKPPKIPMDDRLKPTSIPHVKITPVVPFGKWVPMYPPSKPVYPRKPDVVDTPLEAYQVPHWLYPPQFWPKPHEPPLSKPSKPVFAPPMPSPTRKAEPVKLHIPLYEPFPRPHLDIPPVPTKVPQVTTVSPPHTKAAKPPSKHPDSPVKGPPSMHFDFAPDTSPSPAPCKIHDKVVHDPTPPKAPKVQFNLSCAHSFHCPTCCPGPPSVSYHHHSHHHFGHPFPAPYHASPSLTKITAEIQSPLVQPASSASALFPFIKGTSYYSPYFSESVVVPSAVQDLVPFESPFIKSTHDTSQLWARPTVYPYVFRTLPTDAASPQFAMKPKPAFVQSIVLPHEPTKPLSGSLQNAPIADPVQSLKPVLYQAETQQYVPPWGHHMPMFVAPNYGETLYQSKHEVSSKPTMPPAYDNVPKNYWYQASHALPMSDAPAEISFKETSRRLPLNNERNPPQQSTTPPQPTTTHDINSPKQLNVYHSMQIRKSVPTRTQLYDPQNGKPSNPILRGTGPFNSYWVPVVQSKAKAVRSTHQPHGLPMGPLQSIFRHLGKLKQR